VSQVLPQWFDGENTAAEFGWNKPVVWLFSSSNDEPVDDFQFRFWVSDEEIKYPNRSWIGKGSYSHGRLRTLSNFSKLSTITDGTHYLAFTDVFYIGWTQDSGSLLGEIPWPLLPFVKVELTDIVELLDKRREAGQPAVLVVSGGHFEPNEEAEEEDHSMRARATMHDLDVDAPGLKIDWQAVLGHVDNSDGELTKTVLERAGFVDEDGQWFSPVDDNGDPTWTAP